MSLLENWAFVPGPIFHLHWVFLPLVQMRIFVLVRVIVRYKCPIKHVGSPPHPVRRVVALSGTIGAECGPDTNQ
jgi:hypothetical protein